MRRSQLPLELADHIFAQLTLLELSRVVAMSRFCRSRLSAAITPCSLRLRLGGYPMPLPTGSRRPASCSPTSTPHSLACRASSS